VRQVSANLERHLRVCQSFLSLSSYAQNVGSRAARHLGPQRTGAAFEGCPGLKEPDRLFSSDRIRIVNPRVFLDAVPDRESVCRPTGIFLARSERLGVPPNRLCWWARYCCLAQILLDRGERGRRCESVGTVATFTEGPTAEVLSWSKGRAVRVHGSGARTSARRVQAARRSYRWWRPPTSAIVTMSPSPGGITGRGIGASLSSAK
jgi:hypothetical protein